jgi:twinkle protein
MKLSVDTVQTFPICAIPSRGLTETTAERYGVRTEFDESTGQPKNIYFPVYKDGHLTGYKVRSMERKDFWKVGDVKSPSLFGQNAAGQGGQLIIITEGELDAMSASQMLHDMGKRYRVVSLPNGANISALRSNLEWLEGFDNIVLNFDNDEAGRECLDQAVDLFTPGKIKVMTLPEKDANDMLLKEYKPAEYFRALNSAQAYRPDGIVALADAWELMFADDNVPSVSYPWDGLNEKLYGLRQREIVTLTSGSGMGKSAITREVEHWLLNQTEDNIGILALEESVGRTAWGIVSVEANLPLSIREERKNVPQEHIRNWFNATLGTGRIYTLDHFGSTSEETLLSRVRYLIKGLGCKWIILDHLSIVVSAMDEMGDERKTIDSIMTRLRQLVEETGAGLILVSHLRRVTGDKGHEQGHEVSLAHLRGSQSIAQLSDSVIALERNQQANTEKEANLTTVRVLKNRYAGIVGIATYLYYERDTGRLREVRDRNEFLGLSVEEAGGI